jgi:hypothetical protein
LTDAHKTGAPDTQDHPANAAFVIIVSTIHIFMTIQQQVLELLQRRAVSGKHAYAHSMHARQQARQRRRVCRAGIDVTMLFCVITYV